MRGRFFFVFSFSSLFLLPAHLRAFCNICLFVLTIGGSLLTDENSDDAMRQTRKLQTAINEERQKVDSIMGSK